MDLWSGPLSEFVDHATHKTLSPGMSARFKARHGQPPGVSELNSWESSLAQLGETLRRLRPYGMGVSLTAPLSAEVALPEGPAVSLEYHLPISLRRIDVVLTGRDKARKPTAVVLELKQWSQAALEDEHATNVLVGGEEHLHPSEQALDYAAWLQDYHSAFADDQLIATPAAFCHGMKIPREGSLRDPRFRELLERSPLFGKGEEAELRDFIGERVGGGDGIALLERLQAGTFRPSKKVMESLEAVIKNEDRWHLLDEQRRAYNAIVDEVERCRSLSGRSVVLVRGAPGTGKTVIAVQLLSAALQRGWTAAHATGGKAFTTVMRSKFKGADGLFLWNLHTRKAGYQSMDLLLVDEAHRVRKTSDMRWTPAAERGQRSQTRELMDAAKVSVFLLDENQSIRPDEVGSSKLVQEEANDCGARFKSFDLVSQFRCGGATEYVQWVDRLNDGRPSRPETARILAGFCWPWSAAPKTGPLVRDVVIGDWTRAWNRKPSSKSYKPAQHPYTLWAETDEGLNQIGCIYSAQGFEFDRVGVVWGPDLVWRDGEWVAQESASQDMAVRRANEMQVLVRNAYRVLLTRGMKSVRLLVLDEETRRHIAAELGRMQG